MPFFSLLVPVLFKGISTDSAQLQHKKKAFYIQTHAKFSLFFLVFLQLSKNSMENKNNTTDKSCGLYYKVVSTIRYTQTALLASKERTKKTHSDHYAGVPKKSYLSLTLL
jgi:hypothetical protein